MFYYSEIEDEFTVPQSESAQPRWKYLVSVPENTAYMWRDSGPCDGHGYLLKEGLSLQYSGNTLMSSEISPLQFNMLLRVAKHAARPFQADGCDLHIGAGCKCWGQIRPRQHFWIFWPMRY